jgi:hypothetical protein
MKLSLLCFIFGEYYKEHIEELMKLFHQKEEDALAAKEKMLEAEISIKLETDALEKKEKNCWQPKEELRNSKELFNRLALAPNCLQN